MLAKINKLTNWQVAIIITVLGFAVFFTGLNNPFQGDDSIQIVSNIPVHSISNARLFFEGGTFYNGGGLAPLSGVYYRPLMITVFSFIYTIFGVHPFYYHLFQLAICIGSTFLVYLIFRYIFKPALSLFLALVFLIHPVNSQVVFAIPSMQDALFMFFGLLALWTLLKFRSIKSLVAVTACLTLSMFAKETASLFIMVSLLFLLWFDTKKRLFWLMGMLILPVAAYLFLKSHAVGLIGMNPHNAPIDNLNLTSRLMTAPSIMLLYISKLLFPWRLSEAYYWVNPRFSFDHVLLPLTIDLTLVGLFAYMALYIRRHGPSIMYKTYMFFAVWAALGILIHLQIIPLDFTASEPWLYFSTLPMFGSIAIFLQVLFKPSVDATLWIMAICMVVLGALGVRTALRGLDWSNQYKLNSLSIVADKSNYSAYQGLAQYYIQHQDYAAAERSAEKAIEIYPSFNAYLDLGAARTYEGNYAGALEAYVSGLHYGGDSAVLYENIGILSLVNGDYGYNRALLAKGLERFPHDKQLWTYLAILDDKNGNNAYARKEIQEAIDNGSSNIGLYNKIVNNQGFTLSLNNLGLDQSIIIK